MMTSPGHVRTRQSPPGDIGQLSAENTEKELGEGGVGPTSASSPPCVLQLQLPGPLSLMWRFAQGGSMDYGIQRPQVVIWGPVFNKCVLFSNAFHFSGLQFAHL